MNYRSIKSIACAGVFALVLSGCGASEDTLDALDTLTSSSSATYTKTNSGSSTETYKFGFVFDIKISALSSEQSLYILSGKTSLPNGTDDLALVTDIQYISSFNVLQSDGTTASGNISCVQQSDQDYLCDVDKDSSIARTITLSPDLYLLKATTDGTTWSFGEVEETITVNGLQ